MMKSIFDQIRKSRRLSPLHTKTFEKLISLLKFSISLSNIFKFNKPQNLQKLNKDIEKITRRDSIYSNTSGDNY